MLIRRVVVALGVTLAVAACSSEPEPRPLPPLPSPSATQAAALPVPPEATPETPQGAAAFARYYLELMNKGFASGDSSAVRALSTVECEGCQNLIGAIERGDEPGETVTGGDYEVIFAEAPPIEDGDVIVELRYSLSEVEVRKADGTIEKIPAEPAVDAQMRLLRKNDGWVVQGFRNVTK